MAQKLSISEQDAALIWAYNRGFANHLAARKLYVLMGGLIERFQLDNRNMDLSYGQQLMLKGILNESEAALFSHGVIGEISDVRS